MSLTHIQRNIAQHLMNEIAKELGVHYGCLNVVEVPDPWDELRIVLYADGMHQHEIGYWRLRFKNDYPLVGAWYETRSNLQLAERAVERIHEQMKKEGFPV